MRHFARGLRKKRDLIGAEIGVLAGAHAKELLECLKIKLLYLVDPYSALVPKTPEENMPQDWFDNYKVHAIAQLDPYSKRIKWIFKTSVEAAKQIKDNSLDFVYIDADHSLVSVWEDIMVWTPKVKRGGILAGHDWNHKSVHEAVCGVLGEENIDHDDFDWVYQI